ncbi:hypothetical protein Bca4012_034176 [Brassica carinata]|nr:PREDICTED: WEB family protein At2g38370-like [Brassica oleracea var. oleracea]KAG2285335.1 hypothetical protein Bca52824_044939 [Brassica carinata]CAF1868657.1 unnamed protein product [Brassica napus]VDD15457.1 unnamed protein product [Brassica oleracea]
MSESSPSDSHPSLTANVRAEIDSSSRFVSVREAATRFGGFGFWRPHSSESLQDNAKEGDIIELKRQTAELQNYLMVKECETLDVLKELELTKARIINLNSKLQQKKKKNKESLAEEVHCHIKPAGMVLQDLNKAKMNLCKRTVDLAGLRRSVEVLSKQLKEEKDALEKTRERLMHKSLKVISLEEEEEAKKGETSEKDLENNALRMINEVRRLSCEAQEYKKTGEKAMAEIKHTREKIKTVEIKLVAARKMKEAARAAAEAVAIAEIKAVAGSENTVTISAEEYAKLTLDARDAEEEAWKRVEDAMSTVEEANVSEMDTLKRADEAAQEVEASKRAFEEAVERENTANATKLEAEEALRNLKSEKGQRRRSSVNNTAKFKTRRETITNSLMDVNGLHLTYDFVPGPSSSSVPVLKPTMSIGQILSKKLLVAEDSDMSVVKERSKMSLGQMLAKNSNGDGTLSKKSEGKENEKRSVKRKNLGFAKIVLLLNKESKNNKKNKKIGLNLR